MYGYYRFAVASPAITVADVVANLQEMGRIYAQAEQNQAALIFFPHLSLTGCSCGDLFFHGDLLAAAGAAAVTFAAQCGSTVAVFGLPCCWHGKVYDLFAVAQNGKIKGYFPAECADARCFDAGVPTEIAGVPCGSEVLLDAGMFTITSGRGSCGDVQLVSLPGAALPGSAAHLQNLCAAVSREELSAVLMTSGCAGESTADLIWSAQSGIFNCGTTLVATSAVHENSTIAFADVDMEALHYQRRRQQRRRKEAAVVISCDPVPESPDLQFARLRQRPYLPEDDVDLPLFCRETLEIQSAGIAARVKRCHAAKMVIGISGGLDSTLALLVLRRACEKLGIDTSSIIAVTMPGFGTTGRTRNNAIALAEVIGAAIREISIAESCMQHFEDIGHDPECRNSVYENSQARERTQILMDIANAVNGIVVGTGDLSEAALGWCTYNGDQMSMYGVNASIYKSMISALLEYEATVLPEAAEILQDVVATPVSPELLPAEDGEITQKTESLLGPYELHDFFLWHFMVQGAGAEKVRFLAETVFGGIYESEEIARCCQLFFRRFFQQQFKRSASPDAVQASAVSLSPRGAWQMPSDISGVLWQQK
ncbi:MAG: NAD(+) synthase [Lentisphaeria bacterium]|nr:NAD(+) synthase [Lentisphaeria bacterium]